MNIAETIYQHVKTMPIAKAMEVLHFVESLETKPDFAVSNIDENGLLEFIALLPIGKRTDTEINNDFQTLRDEWDK